MLCQKCGKNIEDTALFCVYCGNKIEAQPAQPQTVYAPQPVPKSNKGLIIGIIAGVAVIAIALILVFVVLPGGGSDIMGKWYDEYGFSTVEFKGGGKCSMSSMGLMELDGDYTFDAGSNKGTITMFGETTEFTLKDGALDIAGAKYSKTPVEQKDIGDLFGDLNLQDFDFNIEG